MQNKTPLIILGLVLALAIVGVSAWAYDFVLGDTAAPSGPVTAVPLVINTQAPPTAPAEATATSAVVAPTEAAVATEPPPTSAPATDGLVLFQIIPAESEVRFSIFEELGGQPKTVIGVTRLVAGQVAVNLGDLAQTQIGVIQVNARDLTTDSGRRNQAIRNRILNTDQFEFVTFTPTAVTGLSGAAQPGQPFTFQIVGDLTIRDITQSVTFNATVQGDSTTRLSGLATTVIQRTAYNLIVPSVPNVANVGEDVTLEIEFVAEAIEG